MSLLNLRTKRETEQIETFFTVTYSYNLYFILYLTFKLAYTLFFFFFFFDKFCFVCENNLIFTI